MIGRSAAGAGDDGCRCRPSSSLPERAPLGLAAPSLSTGAGPNDGFDR
jgi:hypothetical protein